MSVSVFLGLDQPYTCRKILSALSNYQSNDQPIKFNIHKFRSHDWHEAIQLAKETHQDACVFWIEYEDIDFQHVLDNAINPKLDEPKIIANSFCFRKGLIRKAHLAFYVNKHVLKRTNSILKSSFPETHFLELSDIDYLDEALNEAYEVEEYLRKNEDLEFQDRTLFILKPSLADKAADIFMFSTRDELEDFFQDRFDDCDEGDLQFLREWVVQKYIDRPLLLFGGRKFHVRAYVVAVGALRIYLYGGMLALFAKEPYDRRNLSNKFAHITNTCVQAQSEDFKEEDVVRQFWELSESGQVSKEDLVEIFDKMKMITAEVFQALLNEASVFQPLPNCFEVYGFDFLIDERKNVFVLEANAFPDFKQTGDRLEGLVVRLFNEVVEKSVIPLCTSISSTPDDKSADFSEKLHLVLDEDMKRE